MTFKEALEETLIREQKGECPCMEMQDEIMQMITPNKLLSLILDPGLLMSFVAHVYLAGEISGQQRREVEELEKLASSMKWEEPPDDQD